MSEQKERAKFSHSSSSRVFFSPSTTHASVWKNKKAKARDITTRQNFLRIGFTSDSGFIIITRFDYPVPTTYFRNCRCIGFGRSMSTRRELLVEDGKVAAANAIGNTIMKLDKDKLGEDDPWFGCPVTMLGSIFIGLILGGAGLRKSRRLQLIKMLFRIKVS